VHADEKLTAFLELESAIRARQRPTELSYKIVLSNPISAVSQPSRAKRNRAEKPFCSSRPSRRCWARVRSWTWSRRRVASPGAWRWCWCWRRRCHYRRSRCRRRRWCETSLPAVSPAAVQTVSRRISPTPDDHFAARPDRRVLSSSIGRVGGAGRHPAVRSGIVSTAGVQVADIISAPDDHLRSG
jgi:hypothetical protein